MPETLRIGARGSQLSRWQANHIADLLRARFSDIDIEVITIATRGDADRASPLPAIGGAGVFTSALENALRRGEIDCAVHSLKDLPTASGDEIVICAIPERGDPRDALVSRDGHALDQLPFGACVGTGSPRRRAQLLRLRPDLRVQDIRGNVPTRLQKLFAPDSPYDALVLAVAGLARLQLRHHISEIFDAKRMTSAAGQGALAAQYVNGGDWAVRLLAINDTQSACATEAERAFLAALSGGCSLPVGAYARISGGTLNLRGRVTSLDGAEQIDVVGETTVTDGAGGIAMARQLGARLAEEALEEGAGQILQDLLTDRQDR